MVSPRGRSRAPGKSASEGQIFTFVICNYRVLKNPVPRPADGRWAFFNGLTELAGTAGKGAVAGRMDLVQTGQALEALALRHETDVVVNQFVV
jgi:hypothetical protein